MFGLHRRNKYLELLDAMADGEPHYVIPLMKATGFGSGTVYSLLDKAQRQGHVTREWAPAPTSGSVPARMHYQLTVSGIRYVERYPR